jgi:capsular polysaccharide transport system permease protein
LLSKVTKIKPVDDDAEAKATEASKAEPWPQQRRRRLWLKLSFIPCVVLPTLLAIVYFMFVAADKYSVEVKFAVRSPSGFAPADLMGMVTGVSSSGSTVLDSYIVSDYIESKGMLEKLEERMDLRAVYDNDKADVLMRFDREASKEDFLDYFDWMRSVYFETSSQVITVEVLAFTAEDAQKVAEEILTISEELVNRISEEARHDTVKTAEMEVRRAEVALKSHRVAISAFREKEQDIDPVTSAEARQTLLATLESELALTRAEREALLKSLPEDSPQVQRRDSKISALVAELESQRLRMASGTPEIDSSLTRRVGIYEELAVDLEFLQRNYVSALASLEAARLEADRQQRYVATFVHSSLPQEPLYPRRELNCLIVFLCAVMGWGILTMVVYVVREHAI